MIVPLASMHLHLTLTHSTLPLVNEIIPVCVQLASSLSLSPTAGVDFPTDTILFTIPPGNESVKISIPLFDDNIAEDSDQYFVGVLAFEGDYPGATLGRSIVLLGILDNDGIICVFNFSFY